MSAIESSLCGAKIFHYSRLRGHLQISDAYLLALVDRHDGRPVTLDSATSLRAVRGAETSLQALATRLRA